MQALLHESSTWAKLLVQLAFCYALLMMGNGASDVSPVLHAQAEALPGHALGCLATISALAPSAPGCLAARSPHASWLCMLPSVSARQDYRDDVAQLVLQVCCGHLWPESQAACAQPLCPCLQGKAAMAMYAQFEKDRDRNDFSLLPELHSILSGMKVGRGGVILCSLSANPACRDCFWETSLILHKLHTPSCCA